MTSIGRESNADHENVIIFHFRATVDFILIFKNLKCNFRAQKFKIENLKFIFRNQHNFLDFSVFLKMLFDDIDEYANEQGAGSGGSYRRAGAGDGRRRAIFLHQISFVTRVGACNFFSLKRR